MNQQTQSGGGRGLPAPKHPLGRSLLASVGLHAGLLVLLSLPLARPRQPVFAEPIYQVALVNWPEPNLEPPVPAASRKTPPAPQPKPEPKPEPPPPKPKPKAESKIKPMVIPEPVTTQLPTPQVTPSEPAKTDPAEEASSPVTVDGPAPSTEPVSLGGVDQKDFRHNYYLELVRSLLAREWHPPTGGEGVLRSSLHFVIQKDGTIVDPETRVPSGWPVYDRAALAAVIRIKKLPPLPEAYAGESLGLTVTFQRTGDDR